MRRLFLAMFFVAAILLFSGYWSVFAQLLFHSDKIDLLKHMWPYKNEQIQGAYAFFYGENIFFWTMFGLYRVEFTPNARVQYNDHCNPQAVLLGKKYLYFGGINQQGFGEEARNILKSVKPGSVIMIQKPNDSVDFNLSIFSYIPKENRMGGIICMK